MKLSQFKFKLPEEYIAKYPCSYMYDEEGNIVLKEESFDAYRDEIRLLVLHSRTNRIEHKLFKEVLNYFDENDLIIFNDTKVFPALMHGNKEKTNANIEVFLLRELNQKLRLWDVLVEPARKIRVGNKLYFGADNSMVAEVIDNTTSRGRTVRFLYDGTHEEFKRDLFALGNTPLPPHITRNPEPEDAECYQTIFGSAKKAFEFGAKLVKKQKEKKEKEALEMSQNEECYEYEDDEEESSKSKKSKANKVAAAAGKNGADGGKFFSVGALHLEDRLQDGNAVRIYSAL